MEFKYIASNVKALPVLFKKTSSGVIQFWEIRVLHSEGTSEIHTRWGLWDGKIQETMDPVTAGKNLGKKNETSIAQQSEADALSKWESKLKDGYVQSREDAEAGKIDSIIEGGSEPMLAQSYDKHGSKINFPCYVQPKLDGIRCLAMIQNGAVTLWSRSRKRITSCPHIEAALAKQFAEIDVVLDGELYNHDLKHDFEKIISAVRKEDPSEESSKVQYHVYDAVATDANFSSRTMFVDQTVTNTEELKVVQTDIAYDEEDLQKWFKEFKSRGYEGAMARNFEGRYEFKRSYNLQKVKEFEDADFEIIGVQEGKGKLRGLVGAFVCRTATGAEFEAKPKGNQEETKKYLEDESTWKGKKLVVQFQGWTNKNAVPRFPVGLRIKDSVEG